jgi:hypothetical protein
VSTEAHLLGAIARLALNYGRHMDQDAMAGTLDTWRQHLSGYEAVDVDEAVARILGDINVRGMPTVAAVAHLCAESQARRQRAIARPDEHGTVGCLRCDDSGWLDAGTDEDGCEFVRPCPEGCMPPLPGAHRTHRRRRQPTHQGRLAETLPADVIEAQHRMVGDRPDPRDEPF